MFFFVYFVRKIITLSYEYCCLYESVESIGITGLVLVKWLKFRR